MGGGAEATKFGGGPKAEHLTSHSRHASELLGWRAQNLSCRHSYPGIRTGIKQQAASAEPCGSPASPRASCPRCWGQHQHILTLTLPREWPAHPVSCTAQPHQALQGTSVLHGIMEWFGSEGTLKIILVQAPAILRGTSHQVLTAP